MKDKIKKIRGLISSIYPDKDLKFVRYEIGHTLEEMEENKSSVGVIYKFYLCLKKIGLIRFIADIPFVFAPIMGVMSLVKTKIHTPEGDEIVINRMLHSTYTTCEGLENYEPEIRDVIKKLTKPEMTVYDIGANVGVFSFLFASLVGRNGIVYCFEPERNNYHCLEKSLAEYCGGNIALDKRAVGERSGREQFDRRGGAFSGRLIDSGVFKTTHNLETVETICIDDVINNEGYKTPDIVKIDVEGNELSVLKGMVSTIKKHQPIIICELHDHLGEDPELVNELLTSNGYSITFINRHVIAIKGAV